MKLKCVGKRQLASISSRGVQKTGDHHLPSPCWDLRISRWVKDLTRVEIVPRTFQPAATAHWRLNTTRSRPRRLRGQIMEKGPPDFSERVTDDSGAFACICCIYHKMWEPTWRKLAGVRPPNSHRLHATESLGSTVLAQFNMLTRNHVKLKCVGKRQLASISSQGVQKTGHHHLPSPCWDLRISRWVKHWLASLRRKHFTRLTRWFSRREFGRRLEHWLWI